MERLVNLRNESIGTYNRPGHQLRKETDVETIIEPRIDRLYATSIHIHGIADGLENIETDAHRQDNSIHTEHRRTRQFVACPSKNIEHAQMRAQHIVQQIADEIGIFEITEQAQIQHDTQCQPSFALPALLAAMNAFGDNKIGQSTKQQYQQTDTAGFVIEKGAGGKKEEIAQE